MPNAIALMLTIAVLLLLPGPSGPVEYPPARQVDQVDEYHGVRVPDPYRWLEDLDTAETREFIQAQNRLTRSRLDDDARFARLQSRLLEIASIPRMLAPHRRGTRHFLVRTDAAGRDASYFVRTGDGPIQPLLTSQDLGQGLRLARSIAPSDDGRRLAFVTTRGASRWGHLRVLDPATLRITDVLAGVHLSLPSVAWLPDGSGFYYARFTEPPSDAAMRAAVEYPRLTFHRLGTSQAEDRLVHEDRADPTRWFVPRVTEDGRHLIVTTGSGGAPETRILVQDLRRPNATLTELLPGRSTGVGPGAFAFLGADGDRLWFLTTADAPRGRIIEVAIRADASTAREVLAESADAISYVNMVANRFIVFSTREALPRVRIYSRTGRFEREMDLPVLGTVWGPGSGGAGFVGRRTDAHAFYNLSGLVHPGTVFRLDVASGRSSVFHQPDGAIDPERFVGEQVFFTSRDGTRVPMFIARRRDVRPDAKAAAFMYGYGAAGWSAFPWFQPHVLAWIEGGGIYALPGIRGGGEYGRDWHEAGIGVRKQNAIDDYIAAAEWLVKNRYAAAGAVVANGGSLSGALAAAAVLQRPDLFGASLVDIPALDLLRYPLFTGARAWVPELGSPDDPAGFKALLAYSPYHNVADGTCYPPTLVTAGERDETAVPWHAYKFIARLQRAQGCDHPVLLQVVEGAGHTFGTDDRQSAETWARQLTFLHRALQRRDGR